MNETAYQYGYLKALHARGALKLAQFDEWVADKAERYNASREPYGLKHMLAGISKDQMPGELLTTPNKVKATPPPAPVAPPPDAAAGAGAYAGSTPASRHRMYLNMKEQMK